MFFIYSRKSKWHSWYEFTRNQDPFDYLIKTTVFPSTHAITSTQTLSPNLYTPLVPLESRQEDRRFRWCGILQSGVDRIDNGRPILKVTLYVAENPEPGSHTISSIHLGEGLRSVCTPRVSSPLPCPCMERRREESLSDAVDRFKRPFVWTKMDTAIRGSPEEEIPDSRRRYLGRSVTGHVSSSRRQRTMGRGGRERSRDGRRWTGWKSVEITGALPFFLLTANRKRIIGRLIGLFGVICIVAGFPRDGGYNGVVGVDGRDRGCFEHRLTQ